MANLEGKRIRFLAHNEPDPAPLTPGQLGTVDFIDDAGTLHVKWDDGRTLGLVPNADRFEIL